MSIRVIVERLGYRPGDVVSEGDRHYETLKKWAENEDRKGGSIICEFYKPKKESGGSSSEEQAVEILKRYEDGKKCKNEELELVLKVKYKAEVPEGLTKKELVAMIEAEKVKVANPGPVPPVKDEKDEKDVKDETGESTDETTPAAKGDGEAGEN